MSQLRVDVADLLTHPGARRPLQLTAAVDELGGRAATVRDPVELDLLLERIPDGIIVRGTVSARWAAECGICLRPITSEVDLPVAELYEANPIDGETYPIEGHEIDLEQLVRDTVLLELPLAPVCQGEDAETCASTSESSEVPDAPPEEPATDPRWSPLSQLRL